MCQVGTLSYTEVLAGASWALLCVSCGCLGLIELIVCCNAEMTVTTSWKGFAPDGRVLPFVSAENFGTHWY